MEKFVLTLPFFLARVILQFQARILSQQLLPGVKTTKKFIFNNTLNFFVGHQGYLFMATAKARDRGL